VISFVDIVAEMICDSEVVGQNHKPVAREVLFTSQRIHNGGLWRYIGLLKQMESRKRHEQQMHNALESWVSPQHLIVQNISHRENCGAIHHLREAVTRETVARNSLACPSLDDGRS
jgi:hypothetical protein